MNDLVSGTRNQNFILFMSMCMTAYWLTFTAWKQSTSKETKTNKVPQTSWKKSIHMHSFFFTLEERKSSKTGLDLSCRAQITPLLCKQLMQITIFIKKFFKAIIIIFFFQTACKNNDASLSFLIGLQMMLDDNCTCELFFSCGCMEMGTWVWKSEKVVSRLHET